MPAKLTEEDIQERADSCKTTTEFTKNFRTAAQSAKKLGIYPKVTAHLVDNTPNKWTENKLLEAMQCITSRKELTSKFRSLEVAAYKLGIHEEATRHMLSTNYPKEFRELLGVSGLYFLYNGIEIVYIGKSTYCLYGRIISHMSKGLKHFTKVVCYEIHNKSDIAIVEMYLVNKHKPKYNKDSKEVDYPTIEVLGLDNIIVNETSFDISSLTHNVVN